MRSFLSPKEQNTPGQNRFAQSYRNIAVILLNTLLFLALANLFLGVAFWGYDRYHADPTDPPSKTKVKANAFFYADGAPVDNGKRFVDQLYLYDFSACEGISPAEAAAVQDDFYGQSLNWYTYQPWVQFADAPYRSPHLNVLWDEAGILRRRTANPPNPDKLPEILVWTFGGSTTFGYYVADAENWPSNLSQILNERARQEHLRVHIRVENYGRAAYEPNQEAILLWSLLRSGQRPSLVIFMDGVNTGEEYDYPMETMGTSQIFQLMQGEGLSHWPWATILRDIPMVRLGRFLRKKIRGSKAPPPVIPDDQMVRWIANRFKDNWRLAGALCHRYGIELMPCLQPSAYYQYDFSLFRFAINENHYARRRQTAALYKILRRETDCLYLGNLFQEWGPHRKAVLTECHYTPGFNKFLAEQLASRIDLSKLPISRGFQPQEATGAPWPHDLGSNF
jgi:hypothetical protein